MPKPTVNHFLRLPKTHSDHIVTAICAGIALGNMASTKVAINFLAYSEAKNAVDCNPVKIIKYGDMEGCNPDMTLYGFCTEYSKRLDDMMFRNWDS